MPVQGDVFNASAVKQGSAGGEQDGGVTDAMWKCAEYKQGICFGHWRSKRDRGWGNRRIVGHSG